MTPLNNLLEKNKKWADAITQEDSDFFSKLAKQQKPKYLWVGCSDSRVPATQIVDLEPGEIFVHRNIANQVIHTDLNCLSVIQYAVEVLKVEHIIVCGHYGCGGVQASMSDVQYGLIDNWLRHIKDVSRFNQSELDSCSSEEKFDRLCELNVLEQVHNVCHTTIVKNAWKGAQKLSVHGWIYNIENGILKNLSSQNSLS
jgi:carbonic anhydrase